MVTRHIALVPAAGSGQRFGASVPKQYVRLAGQSMIEHTVAALLAFEPFERVIVVVAPGDLQATAVLADLLARHPQRLSIEPVGGSSRAQTVRHGLATIKPAGADEQTLVWVHDAARPAVEIAQLAALQAELALHPNGVVLATPVSDTIKQVNHAAIQSTLDRSLLWQAQTPQCCELHTLIRALDHALEANLNITDEASALEAMGINPRVVQGSARNFKVTTPADAQLMEHILALNRTQSHTQLQTQSTPSLAIGEGMDVHALVPGRPLILGGVTIPHSAGLLGHSDADALLHAITDALLGAAGMGDIGRLFPDTQAAYAGADSQVLLKHAFSTVAAAGWRVLNVDATIVAQAPKMAPHIAAMQSNIAACLNLATTQVNVKAKTNEHLGWLGRQEGIEARAVLLLQRG
jgi:2-C-methyl-D-erythritol 4-phosphate cytidylyltransferase / 2-C-methyl-D-erythritol 2,4-cyclodiphosphate synthase